MLQMSNRNLGQNHKMPKKETDQKHLVTLEMQRKENRGRGFAALDKRVRESLCNEHHVSVVVQSLSRVQLLASQRTAVLQASLSFTISQSQLKLMSIESVMPSNHPILCCSLLFLPSILPSIRVFSSESVLQIRWPKYWSFSFSIIPSGKYSGLISFRMDWLDLLAVQDSQESSPIPQFKNIDSSVLSFLYGPILTSIHDQWKNHSFDQMELCWQSNVSAF